MAKKKRRSRAFIYSFALTFAVLGGLAFALYINTGPVTVSHLPGSIPPYHPVWGKYVPSDAIFVSVVNYTMITATNSSLPGPGALVTLTSPHLTIDRNDIRFLVEVALASPNATIDIAFLKPSAYSTVASDFANQGSSVSVDNFQVYPIVSSDSGRTSYGWIALLPADNAINLGVQGELGNIAITASLDVAGGKAASIMSRPDTNQLFYVVGGATNHYALDIQNFPGLVRTGQLTLTSVDPAGAYVQVSNVVEFADPGTASSQLQTVRNAYLEAHQFVVIDSYVKAIEFHPIGSLEQQVGLTR